MIIDIIEFYSWCMLKINQKIVQEPFLIYSTIV